MSTVLIVEDEPLLVDLLSDYLQASDFETAVKTTGEGVVELVKETPPDLILLDINLPIKNGIDICREIRYFSEVPIIMVTARVDEVDKLLGLGLGADDYICKPCSPREVVARVKTVLRRINRSGSSAGHTLLRINQDTHQAMVREKPVDLTPVELRLLDALLKEPGRILSREQLQSKLYIDNRVVTDRAVDTHVKNLRKKLAEADSSTDYIQSVYGVGYRVNLDDE